MQRLQQQWLQSGEVTQPTSPQQPLVLVVEDDDEARLQLASVLRQAFPNGSVFAAKGMHAALDILLVQPIDIALVDLYLPDGSGIELIQRCFHLSPLTRCVIKATRDEDSHFAQALAAGAFGYLLNEQPETVLIQQLRLIADGIPPLAPSVARRLVGYFMAQTAAVASSAAALDTDDDLIRLSEREKQVLCLIAKGMQISEVARLLEITSNTVCSHIKNIYRKRNVSSRAEAALEAKRLGLV